MAGTSRRTGKRVAVKEWRAQALRLHVDGWTLRDIAKKVGKALSTVHEGIEAELKAITAPLALEVQERRAQQREAEGLRLDALIRGHMAKARAGDAEAAHVVIAAVRQRSKLFGLEAPSRTELAGKDGGPIVSFDMSKLTDEQIERIIAGDATALDVAGGEPGAAEGAGEGGEGTS